MIIFLRSYVLIYSRRTILLLFGFIVFVCTGRNTLFTLPFVSYSIKLKPVNNNTKMKRFKIAYTKINSGYILFCPGVHLTDSFLLLFAYNKSQQA